MTPEDEGTTGYVAALRALSGVLVDRSTLETTLEQLLLVARAAAPHISAITVTAIGDDGGPTSAASTDDAARAVDEHEYLLEEGPCIAALATGEEQLVTDTEQDGRWPRFDAFAADAGFRTVAGLPLAAPDGAVLGALNVFVTDPDALTDDDLRLLRRVAAPAGAVLANARAYRQTAAVGDQLSAALEEQATVHRAVGVILGRHRGTVEEAVRSLERSAETAGRTVHEVARGILAGDHLADREADGGGPEL